ncbi:MAG TPA: hypothetical protein VIR57_00075 [Chloroflexota bacterium]|jgi:hypothetical protein
MTRITLAEAAKLAGLAQRSVQQAAQQFMAGKSGLRVEHIGRDYVTTREWVADYTSTKRRGRPSKRSRVKHLVQ